VTGRDPVEVAVLIPGLAGPEAAGAEDAAQAAALLLDGLDLPGLSRLLARPEKGAAPFAADTLPAMAFEALGGSGEVPAGALARHALAGDAGDAVWIRADPVHLRPDMAKLVLFPPEALSLSLDQAARIAGWLAEREHFPGPPLEPLTATCWTARLERSPALRTMAPAAAHGRDAQGCLPAGEDARDWHARMNEIQMLLHECPVNAEREAAGQAPVNSLWFWGPGVLPPPPAWSGFLTVRGDDPVLRGAARIAGLDGAGVPAEPARWAASLQGGRHLLALDALEAPARAGDPGAWREALQRLDEQWLAALAQALAGGGIARLELHAGGGGSIGMSRRALRRWWRRRRPPQAALAALREGRAR